MLEDCAYTDLSELVGTDAFRKTCNIKQDVPLVEFMYLAFTRMPGESYRGWLRSLLCLCGVF